MSNSPASSTDGLHRNPANRPYRSAVSSTRKKRARLLEQHNFDRLLICDPDGLPDNDQLGSFLLHNTTSLSIAISHRAGLVDPTVAAQRFATLDQLCAGRLAIRMVKAPAAGLPGHEPALEHEAELARADEYLVLLKRLWSNNAPFDHEGPFYSIKNGFAASKPFAKSGLPLILGGASGTAIKVAARHADIFALPAASAVETSRTISRVTGGGPGRSDAATGSAFRSTSGRWLRARRTRPRNSHGNTAWSRQADLSGRRIRSR